MGNQEFTLIEDGSGIVPQYLVEEVIGFSASDEYLRLNSEDKKVPGIVCGALANYIWRMYKESGSENPELKSAFDVIESLSSKQDMDVDNLVVTEILENLLLNKYPELEKMLGIKSRALYERWLII